MKNPKINQINGVKHATNFYSKILNELLTYGKLPSSKKRPLLKKIIQEFKKDFRMTDELNKSKNIGDLIKSHKHRTDHLLSHAKEIITYLYDMQILTKSELNKFNQFVKEKRFGMIKNALEDSTIRFVKFNNEKLVDDIEEEIKKEFLDETISINPFKLYNRHDFFRAVIMIYADIDILLQLREKIEKQLIEDVFKRKKINIKEHTENIERITAENIGDLLTIDYYINLVQDVEHYIELTEKQRIEFEEGLIEELIQTHIIPEDKIIELKKIISKHSKKPNKAIEKAKQKARLIHTEPLKQNKTGKEINVLISRAKLPQEQKEKIYIRAGFIFKEKGATEALKWVKDVISNETKKKEPIKITPEKPKPKKEKIQKIIKPKPKEKIKPVIEKKQKRIVKKEKRIKQITKKELSFEELVKYANNAEIVNAETINKIHKMLKTNELQKTIIEQHLNHERINQEIREGIIHVLLYDIKKLGVYSPNKSSLKKFPIERLIMNRFPKRDKMREIAMSIANNLAERNHIVLYTERTKGGGTFVALHPDAKRFLAKYK